MVSHYGSSYSLVYRYLDTAFSLASALTGRVYASDRIVGVRQTQDLNGRNRPRDEAIQVKNGMYPRPKRFTVKDQLSDRATIR